MTNRQKQKQLHAMFGAYNKRLGKLYSKFVTQLTELAHAAGVGVEDVLKQNPLFRFDDFPELRERFNNIFSDYVQNDMLAYRAGITDGVALAYAHDKAALTAFSVLSDKAIRQARETAATTFIRSRLLSKEGLSLSHLVWNYAQQAKSEFEVAVSNVISDGLKAGTSAEALGRQVRQYLNNPDMMYRRYHRTIVDAQGNKKDIVRWRKRVIGDDGKIHFVEQPLEEVGMGHYRSARKNANRLMRTEINMAYHRANSERWQKEPFVIGIAIVLSPQHPAYDECDELAGRYPKDFVFIGWHPQCLCMANPITIEGEEKKEFYRRLAAGEDMSDWHSKYEVKDIPQRAKNWIDDNREKFIRAGERGKLGYVWRENMKYVGRQFTKEELEKMGYAMPKVKRLKTPEERAAIIQRWHEHQLTRAQIEIKNTGFIDANNPRIVPYINALKSSIETGDYAKISKALQGVRAGIDAERMLIMKTGRNVWGVADNLSYIELNGMKNILRDAVLKKDVVEVQRFSKVLAKEIASINKEAKMLEATIPNSKDWLQQFSLKELKDVDNAVINNIAKWQKEYLTDSYLKSKYATIDDYLLARLKREAVYVVDETYLKPHTLYPTSKVAESAYLNQVSLIEHKIEMKALSTDIAEIKSWSLQHTKSKNVANLLKEAELLYKEDKNIDLLKQKISDAKLEIEKREKEQFRRDMKAGKASSNKLYANGNPFSAEELAKLQDYEKRIIDEIFKKGRWDEYLISEYHDYVLQLSEKYYDKQLSLYTAKENKELKKVIKTYLSHPNAKPRWIWNGTLGGVYNDGGNFNKIKSYLSKGLIKGLTADEVSVVSRFTNGSTFSNCYNLRKESQYWRKKFIQKLKDYTSTLSEVKTQLQYIEEWSKSANYVLDKMVRYNGVTFRGLDGGGGPELRAALEKCFKAKKPWVNNASCSTSMKASVSEGFDDDLMLVIHNKTGAYIHPVSDYSHEYEIMTLRGAKYRVLRPPVHIGSRYWCELEEIP